MRRRRVQDCMENASALSEVPHILYVCAMYYVCVHICVYMHMAVCACVCLYLYVSVYVCVCQCVALSKAFY